MKISDNDICLWTGEIEFEENFEFKFIIAKEGTNSILRKQIGNYT